MVNHLGRKSNKVASNRNSHILDATWLTHVETSKGRSNKYVMRSLDQAEFVTSEAM